MSMEGSYKSERQPLGLEGELERLKAQARVIWKKELRTLGWFGLEDGMAILEAGSGPGFVTELLLNAFPKSTVTALENDPTLVERAKNYLTIHGYEYYEIVERSVTDTGLAENSFDFAYARFLYQHLPDPVAATQELFRVLKPGGVLVVHDRDSGLKALRAPENPLIEQIYMQAAEQQTAWGGSPKVGRKLWQILSEVGFVELDLELLAIHSDANDVESVSWLRPEIVERGIREGWSSAEQGRILLEALSTVNNSPDKYVLQPNILVGGRKPLP
ncbi:MAG TPA: methyltransferase domain-containing protein [Chloroflexia bacterium]|nr:methyltransferase domain-containing protein [Chloroflexia bacterium]